jgi:ArsR family transcriptional regulator, arsenate/arsenite/antimonite-responsive transcriptional repressor
MRSGSKQRKVISRWFHALADETRLSIIDRLTQGEQCVCELTELLDTAQSRLSFHLKTLKDAGVLTDRRQGRWVYYSLNPDVLEDVERFVSSLKGHGQRLRKAANCCQ